VAEKWSYRCQYIRCGKLNCRSCPHGPYWYGFRSEKGRTRSKYFGKNDPRHKKSVSKNNDGKTHKKEHPYDKILSSATANAGLAGEILGVFMVKDRVLVQKRYRELVLANHPDRGGDHDTFVRINAAWSYLCTLYGW
jgi:hypothetical protein